jgi:hypothetical protein
MPLTNADITFINTYVRPMADHMGKEYLLAKRLVSTWNARGGATAIPNDATVVADGAPGDGRPPITNAQVNTIITRATERITDYEATSNAKLNTVLVVAVNTQPGLLLGVALTVGSLLFT